MQRRAPRLRGQSAAACHRSGRPQAPQRRSKLISVGKDRRNVFLSHSVTPAESITEKERI